MTAHKNSSQRTDQPTAKRWDSRLIGGAAISLLGIVVFVAWYLLRSSSIQSETVSQPVQFPHIHGLGFSADGSSLYVPTHIGLVVYSGGKWSIPDIPKHDYMGYAAVDNGFYSSGHPDMRSNLPTRLGLVKSEDEGRTLTTLAFSGESDLHTMAAGYTSHAVYIINPEPNSELAPGMYYTLDEGQTWQESLAQRLPSAPIQLAAHPTQDSTVAVATEQGVYLSSDYGNTFALISDGDPVTAIAFDPDGSRLLFGYQQLYVQNLSDNGVSTLSLPAFSENDAILHIVVNPISDSIALATANLDILLSQDGGATWVQIARQGVG